MTVCIAAICENGDSLVVASDHMVTARHLAAEFEHPDGKIDQLAPACVGLTAGDALVSTDLFRSCRDQIKQLSSPSVEHIANLVKKSFVKIRQRRAEDRLLAPRGMDLSSFYQAMIHTLPTEIAFSIDKGIETAQLPLEIIVAGVDTTGAHIYGIHDPGILHCFDSLGYNAIGSGESHALLVIIGNNHCRIRNLNETVFLTYEAKKKAELAQGVGKTTEMAIITSKKIKTLSDDERDLLENIYREKTSPQIEAVKKAIHELSYERKRSNG